MNTQACLSWGQVTSLQGAAFSSRPEPSLKACSSSITTSQGLRLVRHVKHSSVSKHQLATRAPVQRCDRVVATVATDPTEELEAVPPPTPSVEVPVVELKRAAPAAVAAIALSFPNAIEYESFIHATREALFELGFTSDNCIALVNTCRDEVCRPLVQVIDKEFGHSFNVSGLGGLVTCGVTGLRAGMSHSPEHPCDVDGTLRERYVFFAFPHISIGESGQEGSLLRRGRNKPSSACGALIAVKGAAAAGVPEGGSEPSDDWEFDLLRRKVLSKGACKDCGETGPTLVAVTKAAQEVIREDLEDLIAKTVDPTTADYAVITGVQIHSGCQVPGEPFRMDRIVDYIAPSSMYAVIRGEKYVLHCEVNQITKISSIKAERFSGSEAVAKPEEKVKVTGGAIPATAASVDTQAQLDEGRAAMRDWWLAKLEQEKLGASSQAEMDEARAEMRAWWLSQLEAKLKRDELAAAQVEMDKGRAEMRAWWLAQLEQKEARDVAAKEALMDESRADMRAWWLSQLEEKEKAVAAATNQEEMDKARAEMRTWWLSQLADKEKAGVAAAAQEQMDKCRAEMRAWWQSELEKKAEREAAAKQAEMDTARAEMKAWADAKQAAQEKAAQEKAAQEKAAQEAAAAAAAAAAKVEVVEEPVVEEEEEEDKQVVMDRARAEMRNWWLNKWESKKKAMGWEPYAPAWVLQPAEGSLITTPVSLAGNGIVVGSAACDPSQATPLVVDLPEVSAQHAKVYGRDLPRRDRVHERAYFVMDLGSKEGTFMNKLKLQPNKEVRVMDGDTLKFGDAKVALVVRKGGAPKTDEPSWAFWGA